jgi:hypothetical protein
MSRLPRRLNPIGLHGCYRDSFAACSAEGSLNTERPDGLLNSRFCRGRDRYSLHGTFRPFFLSWRGSRFSKAAKGARNVAYNLTFGLYRNVCAVCVKAMLQKQVAGE